MKANEDLTPEKLIEMTDEEYRSLQPVTVGDGVKECWGCTDCSDCEGCSDCTDCTDCCVCSDCSDCSECTWCFNCSSCTDCTNCLHCTRCIGIAGGSNLKYVCYGVQFTKEQWKELVIKRMMA